MALRHWMILSLTEGIGPILTQRLIATVGEVEKACDATLSMLQGIEGIGGAKSRQIHESMRRATNEVDAELNRAHSQGVQLLCRDDSSYPVLLRGIPDPPPVLYLKGTLEPRDLNALAIVGSRRCSYYGREQSERFAALLAGAGLTVISGGARGIDSAAHRGAMSHPQGRTIAVLGSGVDVAYPPENASLFEQIAQRGAVISEYPLGTPPLAENFPRRNRIVSGLSRGVLVIEADQRSGALITARQACDDHGRPVFALPGRVDNKMSAGPHLLIRDGATLVTNLEDILENLGPVPQEAMENSIFQPHQNSDVPRPEAEGIPDRPLVSLTDRQQLILSHLSAEPTQLDGIIQRTSLEAHSVLQDLTMLSLKGIVRRIDGQSYMRAAARLER